MPTTGKRWPPWPSSTVRRWPSSADTLDDLADLTEKIKGKGVEDMVLDPASARSQQARWRSTPRSAGWRSRRTSGRWATPDRLPRRRRRPGPRVGAGGPGYRQVCRLRRARHFAPELVYPLLVLRQNIYTDPQKPIQVQPGLYEINDPKPEDPVLVTTNFSITYFSVANEVEGAGLPAWLLVADAEGMSVLTAWAAGKFDAERIAKAVKAIRRRRQSHQKAHRPARPRGGAVRRVGGGVARLGNPRRPTRGSRSACVHETGAVARLEAL